MVLDETRIDPALGKGRMADDGGKEIPVGMGSHHLDGIEPSPEAGDDRRPYE